MPHCRSCNTRLSDGDRACPNCGRTLSPGSSLSGMQPLELQPPASVEAAPPPQAKPAPPEEPAAPEKPAAAEKKAAVREKPAPPVETSAAPEPPEEAPEPMAQPKPVAAPKKAPAAPPAPEMELSEAVEEAASGSLFTLRAEELRARIVEQPALLEPGLEVYRDPRSGEPAGVELSTDVGDIDLLAQDADGALVVVRVCGQGDDAVGPVLEQLGWVAKHLADGRRVRALVLLDPPAPELGYSARALAGAGQVSFKTWRVTVAVDDVPL